MLLVPFSSCCCYELNFGYLVLLLLQRLLLLLLLLLVPGWENTMAVKDAGSPKFAPRKCLT